MCKSTRADMGAHAHLHHRVKVLLSGPFLQPELYPPTHPFFLSFNKSLVSPISIPGTVLGTET